MKLVPSGLRAEYPFESFETKRVRVSGLNAHLTKVSKKNACFRQIFCQDGRRNALTSSTLSRGHPGRPKERLLAAFNERCARLSHGAF